LQHLQDLPEQLQGKTGIGASVRATVELVFLRQEDRGVQESFGYLQA
jgi:hypothetical protein